MSVKISVKVRRKIVQAAQNRCGYCLTSQEISGAPMHLDHLIPLAKGGTSDETNLWLACAWCNGFKGQQTQAIDPVTQTLNPLFNPRTQLWLEHFEWDVQGCSSSA